MRSLSMLKDDRGVSVVIVGVSLVAIFASAMLSVDAGNLWQSRRRIITATDASALQEARTAALRGPSEACLTTAGVDPWEVAVTANAQQGESIGCDVVSFDGGESGYVTVDARNPVDIRFGGVVGIGDTSAYSLSGAQWGYVTTARGLRPIGICSENDHVKSYFDPDFTDPGDGDYELDGETVHRIVYTKDGPDECGEDAPGNWGFQDFDGGNNSQDDLIQWMLEGYDGEVGIEDCNADEQSGDGCQGNTGAGSGNAQGCPEDPETLAEALECIKGKTFPIVIYDAVDCSTPSSMSESPRRGLGTGTLAAHNENHNPTGGGGGGNTGSGGTGQTTTGGNTTTDGGNGNGGSGGQGGGGANCTFNIVAFLGVKLIAYDISGSQSDRYFDFVFVEIIFNGTCCSRTPVGINRAKGIKLCAADHDSQSIEDRCTPV